MTDPLPLPSREGSRPLTSTELPHSQLDQQPSDSRYVDAIVAEALAWQSVLAQPSAIAVEGARALTLDGSAAGGPAEAFLVGREFCHVHAKGDLSLHAALPLPVAGAAERGRMGRTPLPRADRPSARDDRHALRPRDDLERDVVLRLVRPSYEFALAGEASASAVTYEGPSA